MVVECCSQASSRPGSGEGAEYGWYRDHQCFLSFADQFGCPVSKPLRPHHSITSLFSTPLICVPSRSNHLIMPATAIHMGHSVDHNAPVAPLLALSHLGASLLTRVQCLLSAGLPDIHSHTPIALFGQAAVQDHTPQPYRIGLTITRSRELMDLAARPQNQQG